MTSQKSRTLFIILSIVAFIIICAYVFIILNIRAKVGDLSVLEAQTQEEQTYARDNHTLENLLIDTKPDIDNLSAHFVSSDGTVPFIESVEALATSKKLTSAVSSISATDAPTDGFSLMNVVLTTSGSWSSTYAFLKALESMPYEISIASAVFNQSGGQIQAGLAKVPAADPHGWDATFTFSVLQKK